MTELCIWRARIGKFNFVYCAINKVRAKLRRVQEEKLGVEDIVLGYLCLCFLVLFAGCARHNALLSLNSPVVSWNSSELVGKNKGTLSYTVDEGDLFSNVSDTNWTSVAWHGLDPLVSLMRDGRCVVILAVNLVFCAWRLILSHDVELNPGPPKKCGTPKQDSGVESRIARMEETMDEKLSKIMKALQDQTQAMLNIENVQNRAMNSIAEINKKLTDLTQVCNKNSEAIRELKTNQKEVESTLGGLQDEIDRLEGFSRRNNVKLFGIPEGAENNSTCEKVVTKVLTDYYPDEQWGGDVIERAHRLGRYDSRYPNSRPRPVIAKFQRWGDAMRVMKNRGARDNMEKDNIRLAQDLTRRQSDQLRSLREEGKSAYFVKGKLQVRDFTSRTHFKGAWHESTNRGRPLNEIERPTTGEGRLASRDVRTGISDFVGVSPGDQPIRGAEGGDVTSNVTQSLTASPSLGQGKETEREGVGRPLTRSVCLGAGERQVNLLDMWSTCSTQNNNDARDRE